MKKVFLFIAILVAATSCKEQFHFVYNATINGDADGGVNVSFPDGSIDLKGDADLKFHYGNDTTAKVLLGIDQIKADKKLSKAYVAAQSDFEKQFNAAAASGTYLLNVDAYCYEELTGLRVEFKKTLTNR